VEATLISENTTLTKKHQKTPTELLVSSSGKLVLLDKLLPKLRENGSKVLIFCTGMSLLTDHFGLEYPY
jgi:SNF2 family DNA or RNA helicase